MKTIFSTFIFAFVISVTTYAQAPPDAFNYSAVARNAEGVPISEASLGIQISIRQSTADGALVYQENHTVETDGFGLFNLAVGTGSVEQGSMQAIEWGQFEHFLEVGMDVNGGTNFQIMGITQMLSVPYALHAKTAEIVTSAADELYIGMEYQGGIIFHLFTDETGMQHGLIVALTDAGEGTWGFYEFDVPGAQSTWNGAANSADIIAAGGLPGEAAGLCDAYESGGFTDWYLPSLLELSRLWSNNYDVAKALYSHPDGMEMEEISYWSSTEHSQYGAAWVSLESGNVIYDFKTGTRKVRAVRAF